MKNSGWILAICLAASAWAQSPAAKLPVPQTAARPGLPKQTTATQIAAKPSAGVKQPAAGHPALSQANAQAAAAGKSPASPAAKTAAAQRRKGERDPFVSPIAERARSGPACTGTGKRCLYVGDLNLLGIVESEDGAIAVVASGSRTYFLREHDPLADGEVEKITRDAITMRQRSSDLLGKPVLREVVRKLGGPAV
jgi:hypothetical protein